jgi:hypothetical protein
MIPVNLAMNDAASFHRHPLAHLDQPTLLPGAAAAASGDPRSFTVMTSAVASLLRLAAATVQRAIPGFATEADLMATSNV